MLLTISTFALLGRYIGGVVGAELQPRTTNIPRAISFTPAQNWEGIDGQWNTFALRIGTSPQAVRVQISTASQETWVVDPRACLYENNKEACGTSRGGLFTRTSSTTWSEQGLYDAVLEKNLNYSGNAIFGYDVVSLGYAGEVDITLKQQIVGAQAAEDFWFGHFGLHPKSTNFTDIAQNIPSYLSSLKTANLIPSVAWGYTAGAAYRFAKVPASLTLGGYDSNKFIKNDVTFGLAPDNDRDLLVYLSGITASSPAATTPLALLPSPIYTYIDSTVAEIWLPIDACRKFEEAFGITYDQATQLYFVTDKQHDALRSANPNITFTLSTAPGSNSNVQISFPYLAFDLTAKPPYRGIETERKFFPLRRAANNTQYTLGRTFLQEAYLTVDWERQNFSVSQVSWVPNNPQALIPILSINGTTIMNGSNRKNKGGSLNAAVVAGASIGVIVLLIVIGVLSCLLWRSNRRRKQREQREFLATKKLDETESKSESDHVIPKVELDAGEESTLSSKGYYKPPYEPPLVEAPANAIFELPGDMPNREADGRELSEKEAIRVREQRYNGREEAAPTYSPISPLSPGQDNELARRITNDTATISPVSPQDRRGQSATSTMSPVSPQSATTLSNPKSRLKRLIHPDNVAFVGGRKGFGRRTKGTPGEHLEGSSNSSLSPSRGQDDSPDRKRFSFEK